MVDVAGLPDGWTDRMNSPDFPILRRKNLKIQARVVGGLSIKLKLHY